MSSVEFIRECQEKVFAGTGITSEDAKRLLNISDEDLGELAKCANEITQDFNGKKVDVEQLNNIKKNACSEDCTFCGQSAFFDTGIETYQLPSAEEVVLKAQKQKKKVLNHIALLQLGENHHQMILIKFAILLQRLTTRWESVLSAV